MLRHQKNNDPDASPWLDRWEKYLGCCCLTPECQIVHGTWHSEQTLYHFCIIKFINSQSIMSISKASNRIFFLFTKRFVIRGRSLEHPNWSRRFTAATQLIRPYLLKRKKVNRCEKNQTKVADGSCSLQHDSYSVEETKQKRKATHWFVRFQSALWMFKIAKTITTRG